jgi:hypothetical protein
VRFNVHVPLYSGGAVALTYEPFQNGTNNVLVKNKGMVIWSIPAESDVELIINRNVTF